MIRNDNGGELFNFSGSMAIDEVQLQETTVGEDAWAERARPAPCRQRVKRKQIKENK